MAEILIKSLRKNYHKTAVLHGIDLAIQDGEFIAILGPSGCGKSTLLRMIAGLESVSAGTIEIDGKVVNELEPRERNCAMVFQNYALYPHMSVSDNIGYALKVAGVSRTERESRILKVAKSVGLETFLNRKPGELSGGQRQRVAMARAIIREPGVFLFDEPLSNLDAKLRGQMRHEVRRIHNQIGATSVFVTHDQQEGMTMADRMVIMKDGYVEQIGAPKAIYDQPQTLFVAGFVGPYPMNFIEAKQIGNTLHLPNAVTLPIANAAPERTVTVGLRPETLKVVPPEQGDCQCRLEFAEELGIGQLCHLDYEGNTIMALAEGWDHSLVAGETLGLQFGAIHVFDHETGKRIVN